jgi:flagellar hook-associated protein 3 FlgL
MRVSTANAYDASIEQLQRRQQQLPEGQLQLTSMKRVNRASDDPTAAARAERALAL